MKTKELLLIASVLILASAGIMWAHVLIFHDEMHMWFYLVHDLGFLPLEVLLVGIVIERLLSARERRNRQYKLYMVIGAFFSAVGQQLLGLMARLACNQTEIFEHAAVGPDWSEAQIKQAIAWSKGKLFDIRAAPEPLDDFRRLLTEHREFMLRLLENPTLLEHEEFSDLLWAVFHLQEELGARNQLDSPLESDLKHLESDIERAYTQLITQWLQYMIHLKRDYPFLFSLAARMNPLRPGACAEVT